MLHRWCASTNSLGQTCKPKSALTASDSLMDTQTALGPLPKEWVIYALAAGEWPRHTLQSSQAGLMTMSLLSAFRKNAILILHSSDVGSSRCCLHRFVEASQEVQEVAVGSITITIHQNLKFGLGAAIWNSVRAASRLKQCGFAFLSRSACSWQARFFLDCLPTFPPHLRVAGKRLVELGSGTGTHSGGCEAAALEFARHCSASFASLCVLSYPYLIRRPWNWMRCSWR